MKSNITEEKQMDFYSPNQDWTGRLLDNTQEVVTFYNNSTMRIWCNEQSDDYNTHWHSAMEIIMPVENYYDAVINEQDYHVLPGEILVIPPGELHKLIAPASGQRFIFLFDLSPLVRLKSFSGIQSLLAHPLFVTPDTYPLIYDDVYQFLVQIRNEYFHESEYAELAIFSLLLSFLVKFGYNHLASNNLFPNVKLFKQKEYVQKFNNLMDYIDDHYMEDLNLDNIAASTGFSKYHFSRLFKQYTNFTFCDYLCHRRIKVAEELLAQPDLPITTIALQAGFPSISTFNRLFKQHKNCTPSEYRSKLAQPHFG